MNEQTIEVLLQKWSKLDLAIKAMQTAQLSQMSEKCAMLERERHEMAELLMSIARAAFAHQK